MENSAKNKKSIVTFGLKTGATVQSLTFEDPKWVHDEITERVTQQDKYVDIPSVSDTDEPVFTGVDPSLVAFWSVTPFSPSRQAVIGSPRGRPQS